VRELSILTAIHGRQSLSVAMAQHAMTTQIVGWKVNLLAVVSLEDARDGAFMDALRATRAKVFAFPNSPLAFKWQAGLSMIRAQFPATDAVMSLGSDDFASADYMAEACRRIEEGEAIPFGKNQVHMCNGETGEIALCQHGNPALTMGAGRMYPRQALDKLEWVLWTQPLERGLDNSASVRCYEAGMPIKVDNIPHMVVDVKTTNMNPWDKLEKHNLFSQVMDGERSRELLESANLGSVLRWLDAHAARSK
jgi:hypothetical protein